MSAIRFVKDGKSVWTKDNKTFSVAVQHTTLEFNLETGWETPTKNIMFLKGNDEASISARAETVIKAINAGQLMTYRAFSKTPFYDTQESDMNPSTGEILNRYSETRLCPTDKFIEKNRQYVTVPVAVATEPIAAEA